MKMAFLALLGGFRLTASQGQIVDVPAKKDRALLAILAMAPRNEATRDRLTSLLWSDRGEEQAKNSLRQALTSLRKDFAVLGAEPLAITGDHVALDPRHIAIDVVEFLNASASSDPTELRQAAQIYAGPLVDGLTITDDAFEDWLRDARADLSARAIKAFQSLVISLTGHERIVMAERLIALEPLREASHLALMQAHIAQGQSALAIKQYETCKLLLKRELGVEPGEEMQQLRRTINYTPVSQSAGVVAIHKPTIAVLPFENMSGDPGQEFFSDGITEDLIIEIGRFGELNVIARNSAFTFKGRTIDARSIGKQLSADYLLQGSVRRANNRVRITAQLIETVTENQMWADRYDREVTDIFELQGDIALSVATAIVGRVRTATVEKIRGLPVTQLDSYQLYLQARIHLSSFETAHEAEPYLVRALELDPNVATTQAMMASIMVIRWFSDRNPETLKDALAHGRRAVSVGPLVALSYAGLGHALIFMRQLDEALVHLDHGVSLSPNDVWVRCHRAICLNYLGRYEEALSDIDICVSRAPGAYDWYWDVRGQILLALGRYQEAIDSYRNLNVFAHWAYAYLAICHLRLGDREMAADAIRQCLTAMPNVTVEFMLSGDPYRDTSLVEGFRKDLITLGIPKV